MIYAYIRVSTLEQAGEGTTSLGEQARKCKALATAFIPSTDLFDIQVIEDRGVSGALPLGRRPEGGRMLSLLQAGDIVIASKLDRLFRSAVDALQTIDDLNKRKVGVILADFGAEPIASSPIARLFFSMLSSFAEFERHRIAERMTDGKAAKKRRGGAIGGMAPFGWRVVGSGKEAVLEKNPEEQTVLEEAVELWRKFDYRPYRATQALNERGYRTRAGKPFLHHQVERFVKRELERRASH